MFFIVFCWFFFGFLQENYFQKYHPNVSRSPPKIFSLFQPRVNINEIVKVNVKEYVRQHLNEDVNEYVSANVDGYYVTCQIKCR